MIPSKLSRGDHLWIYYIFYDKDFTYKLIATKNGVDEIEMKPIDKRKNFQKVNVFIQKSKQLITKANIVDKGGNIITFSLTNINTNAVLPDNDFVFNRSKYKNVDIIE